MICNVFRLRRANCGCMLLTCCCCGCLMVIGEKERESISWEKESEATSTSTASATYDPLKCIGAVFRRGADCWLTVRRSLRFRDPPPFSGRRAFGRAQFTCPVVGFERALHAGFAVRRKCPNNFQENLLCLAELYRSGSSLNWWGENAVLFWSRECIR